MLFMIGTAVAGTTAPSSGAAPVPVAEKASSDFPFTFQGLFGKGANAEISLRDKTTSRSIWLKTGASAGKWKLENIDTKTARATFTSGNRRVELRLAGEGFRDATLPVPAGESIVHKRLGLALKGSQVLSQKYSDLHHRASEQLGEIFRAHPEYLKESDSEYPPKHTQVLLQELRREYESSDDPDIARIKAVELAAIDAQLNTQPTDEERDAFMKKNLPNRRPDTLPILIAFQRRVDAEADRLYLTRGGSKTTDDLPPPDKTQASGDNPGANDKN